MVRFQKFERRVQVFGHDGSNDITARLVTHLLDHLLTVILHLGVILDKPMQGSAMTT
jgi:hypothetical protein